MRTARITIDGAEYLLCFSARVVRACTERYGDITNIDKALTGGSDVQAKDKALPRGSAVQAMDEAVWMIAAMMDAGARYAKLNGLDNPPPLTEEELLDVCDLGDFTQLTSKITETITNGKTPTVEAEPAKNAKATPAGA